MSADLNRVIAARDISEEFAKSSDPRDMRVFQQQQHQPHTAAQRLQQQQQQRQM